MKRFLIFSDNHGINIYLKEVLDQIGTDLTVLFNWVTVRMPRQNKRSVTSSPARFIWCVVIVMV